MTQLLRKVARAVLNYDPSFCDMYEDEHARAAASEYLDHIRRHLRERFGNQRLVMLDAGCQAGRLLIPLAQDGHSVIGVDASSFNLRRARAHAKEQQVTVRLIRGDIANLSRWIRPASLDGVVCAEVLYLCPNYRTLLQRLIQVMKPGGLLFVSHRPTSYYVTRALLRAQSEQATSFIGQSEGPSTDGAYHNWQTPEQLAALYGSLHLRLIRCYPIDDSAFQLDLSLASEEVKQFLESARMTDPAIAPPRQGGVSDMVMQHPMGGRDVAPPARPSPEPGRAIGAGVPVPRALPVGLHSTFRIPTYFLVVAEKPRVPTENS